MIDDRLRAPGADALRARLRAEILEFEGARIDDDLPFTIMRRLRGIITTAEFAGELTLPERIVTAGELRTALGGKIPGFDFPSDDGVMWVTHHDVRVSVDIDERRIAVKIVPVAEWRYEGVFTIRVPELDVELALDLYRARGGQ